jgi:hypothetical protein
MTQNEPLDIKEFIDQAQKRGFRLRAAALRELYRHRLLIPLIQITKRQVREPVKPVTAESPFGGTRLIDLRLARDTGRLRDLAAIPYQPRLSFEPTKWTWPANSPWTGLLYSPYQLLALPELNAILAEQTYHKRGEQIIARMPKPSHPLLDRMERFRKIAIALTAVEARYLPNLDPEFIQLNNVHDVADWAEYRAGFNPVQAQEWLSYPTAQISQDAEFLLLMRAHRMDPVGNSWSQLMRRAPAKSRKHLKDAALIAMDDRIAAEILLRFYEELALRGHAEPLPDISGTMSWHPLHERLSDRKDTLDEALTGPGHLSTSTRGSGAGGRNRGVPRPTRLAHARLLVGTGAHPSTQTRRCRSEPAEGGRIERSAFDWQTATRTRSHRLDCDQAVCAPPDGR